MCTWGRKQGALRGCLTKSLVCDAGSTLAGPSPFPSPPPPPPPPPSPSALKNTLCWLQGGERLDLEWDKGRVFDQDVATMFCQMVGGCCHSRSRATPLGLEVGYLAPCMHAALLRALHVCNPPHCPPMYVIIHQLVCTFHKSLCAYLYFACRQVCAQPRSCV
jgi:hypothetical protein